jgi:hypothetical protein
MTRADSQNSLIAPSPLPLRQPGSRYLNNAEATVHQNVSYRASPTGLPSRLRPIVPQASYQPPSKSALPASLSRSNSKINR